MFIKRLSWLVVIALILFSMGTAIAADFDWADLWPEHRYHADSGIERFYIRFSTGIVNTEGAPAENFSVYVQNVPNVTGDLELPHWPGWSGPGWYYFGLDVNDPEPGPVWERSYLFYIDENDNGNLDTGESTRTYVISPGTVGLMGFVRNVNIYGSIKPVVVWDSAAEADHYRIRVFPVVNGEPSTDERLYDSENILEDGSGRYAYIYTGDLFAQNETLSIGIEARDIVDEKMIKRSRYLVKHSAFHSQPHCDVNSDGKIGLEEAVHALQIVAGIKPSIGNTGIVGSWGVGHNTDPNEAEYMSLTLYPNGYYIHWESDKPNEPCDNGGGVEYGTYTYNAISQQATVNPILDQNGCFGPSESGQTEQWRLEIVNDILYGYRNDIVVFSYERVK